MLLYYYGEIKFFLGQKSTKKLSCSPKVQVILPSKPTKNQKSQSSSKDKWRDLEFSIPG